jgi:vacuolar-type H+-ATPase subunit I/STV1
VTKNLRIFFEAYHNFQRNNNNEYIEIMRNSIDAISSSDDRYSTVKRFGVDQLNSRMEMEDRIKSLEKSTDENLTTIKTQDEMITKLKYTLAAIKTENDVKDQNIQLLKAENTRLKSESKSSKVQNEDQDATIIKSRSSNTMNELISLKEQIREDDDRKKKAIEEYRKYHKMITDYKYDISYSDALGDSTNYDLELQQNLNAAISRIGYDLLQGDTRTFVEILEERNKILKNLYDSAVQASEAMLLFEKYI